MKINAFQFIHAISGHFAGKTFQIRADGTNIVFERPYFAGLPNATVDGMIARYNSLTGKELKKWKKIARQDRFYSRYQAFASSFFYYSNQYGLGKALVDPIPYAFSQSRIEKAKRLMWLVSQRISQVEAKTDIQDSLDQLFRINKNLIYFYILPLMRSESDISEASVLNLIQPKTGFGTSTFGTGGFGSPRP